MNQQSCKSGLCFWPNKLDMCGLVSSLVLLFFQLTVVFNEKKKKKGRSSFPLSPIIHGELEQNANKMQLSRNVRVDLDLVDSFKIP